MGPPSLGKNMLLFTTVNEMARKLEKVIGVRLSVMDAEALSKAAELRGLRSSQFVRQLILEWLSSQDLKVRG